MRLMARTRERRRTSIGWTTTRALLPALGAVLWAIEQASGAVPAAARTELNCQQVVLDNSYIAYERDVGDIDGDGRNDVAFSHSERAGYTVAWYSSATPRGDGSWSKHTVAVVDYRHTLQAADFDLDGDVDLLVGGMIQSQHRGLMLMLNSDEGTNWTAFVIQTDGSYSAEIGDIDNDSDPDIVGIRNWNAAPTWIYRNNVRSPDLYLWTYHQVSAAHVRTFGLCFPDVDRDGDRLVEDQMHKAAAAPLRGAFESRGLKCGIYTLQAGTIAPSQAPQTTQRQIILTPNPWEE